MSELRRSRSGGAVKPASRFPNNEMYDVSKIGEEFKIDKEDRSVIEYLHTQTVYISSMTTYSEVNSATQHAIDHLVLTQVGMKDGVKIWGSTGAETILKKMRQFRDRNVVKQLQS